MSNPRTIFTGNALPVNAITTKKATQRWSKKAPKTSAKNTNETPINEKENKSGYFTSTITDNNKKLSKINLYKDRLFLVLIKKNDVKGYTDTNYSLLSFTSKDKLMFAIYKICLEKYKSLDWANIDKDKKFTKLQTIMKMKLQENTFDNLILENDSELKLYIDLIKVISSYYDVTFDVQLRNLNGTFRETTAY